jgi:hypothetical protein
LHKLLPGNNISLMIFKKDNACDLPIGEYYINKPNVNVRKVIERLLRIVPKESVKGLGGIILCDTAKFKEHYGEKEEFCSASYNRAKDNKESPWIEICVDRYIGDIPKWALKFSAITDLMLSQPLYHEIGHHIDCKNGNNSEFVEKEAEKWGQKFGRHYMFRYHFLFFLLAFVIIYPFRRRFAKICGYKQSEQA